MPWCSMRGPGKSSSFIGFTTCSPASHHDHRFHNMIYDRRCHHIVRQASCRRLHNTIGFHIFHRLGREHVRTAWRCAFSWFGPWRPVRHIASAYTEPETCPLCVANEHFVAALAACGAADLPRSFFGMPVANECKRAGFVPAGWILASRCAGDNAADSMAAVLCWANLLIM